MNLQDVRSLVCDLIPALDRQRENQSDRQTQTRCGVPDVAVVDVECETHDAQQDAEAGEHRHGDEELLGEVAVLEIHQGPVCRRASAWDQKKDRQTDRKTDRVMREA